ncbi:MAG: catalase, partial [Candidatus Thiodiazotropha sp. (ex Lucinoma kastoroae)]|nr:catalase [Candidatus Thiodiazotropha sp. (ex Lucinoma kastoroae)]
YRIGINYAALDVNKPRCPVHSYHKDGQTRFDGNGGGQVVYQPNSFSGPVDDARYKEPPLQIDGDADRYDHWVDNEDYYSQAGDLFRLMDEDAQQRLIDNLVGAMKDVPHAIQVRQIGHFHKADSAYGERVAQGLGVRMDEVKSAA